MLMRLQKYLALCGIAARRKCETLISQGRVSVNGEIVTKLGTKIDPEKDAIELNGDIVHPPERFGYYVLNKPDGVVVTVSDSHGAKTVMDLLNQVTERIFPVGRLDLNTEGLLILTNDGELANRLIHPRYHLEKEYILTVKKPLNNHNLRWLRKGVNLDGKPTLPAEIRQIRKDRRFARYKVVIREGRKRQIRRMFRAVGHPVLSLKRVAIGPLRLGRLRTGDYRRLTRQEVSRLRRAVGLEKSPGKPPGSLRKEGS